MLCLPPCTALDLLSLSPLPPPPSSRDSHGHLHLHLISPLASPEYPLLPGDISPQQPSGGRPPISHWPYYLSLRASASTGKVPASSHVPGSTPSCEPSASLGAQAIPQASSSLDFHSSSDPCTTLGPCPLGTQHPKHLLLSPLSFTASLRGALPLAPTSQGCLSIHPPYSHPAKAHHPLPTSRTPDRVCL